MSGQLTAAKMAKGQSWLAGRALPNDSSSQDKAGSVVADNESRRTPGIPCTVCLTEPEIIQEIRLQAVGSCLTRKKQKMNILHCVSLSLKMNMLRGKVK